MKKYVKKAFPLAKIRRFLEPGPVVLVSSRYPKTVHYRGDGVFMISGRSVSYRSRFKAGNL